MVATEGFDFEQRACDQGEHEIVTAAETGLPSWRPVRGNQIPRSNPGTGRKGAGNRSQGDFQNQARQLTSPAIGRAIL